MLLHGFLVFSWVTFFILASGPVSAAEWMPSDQDASLAHFPTKIVNDLPNLFTDENITPFAVGTLATALDWSLLDSQNSLASNLDRLNIEPVFDFGEFYGQGWIEGSVAVGSWGLGALLDDNRLQLFGRDMVETLVLDTSVGEGLKFAVNRTRPNGAPYSFPSGHTGVAFCVAPVIQRYWGWEFGIPAYALATLTGLERVEDHWHYLSDVLAAATLGIVIGNGVVHSPKNISFSAMPGGLEVTFALD